MLPAFALVAESQGHVERGFMASRENRMLGKPEYD
jgi:hypothetical protein